MVLPKHLAKLSPGRISPMEFEQQIQMARIPAGVEFEDVLKPDYWVHYHGQLEADTIVVVKSDEGKFYGWLWCMSVSRSGCRMQELWVKHIEILPEELETDDHYIKWINIGEKHGVFVRATDELVRGGFKTKPDAIRFMLSHEKAMAA